MNNQLDIARLKEFRGPKWKSRFMIGHLLPVPERLDLYQIRKSVIYLRLISLLSS